MWNTCHPDSPCNIIGPTNNGGSCEDLRSTFLCLNTITVTKRELRLKVLSKARTAHNEGNVSTEQKVRISEICSWVNRITLGDRRSCMLTACTKSSSALVRRVKTLCTSSVRFMLLLRPSHVASLTQCAATFCTYRKSAPQKY